MLNCYIRKNNNNKYVSSSTFKNWYVQCIFFPFNLINRKTAMCCLFINRTEDIHINNSLGRSHPFWLFFFCANKSETDLNIWSTDVFSMFRSKNNFAACFSALKWLWIHTSLIKKLHTNLVVKMQCMRATGNILFFWPID